MNPVKPTFFLLLLFSTLCFGQTFSGTFQGEVAGLAPAFLYIEAKSGAVTGYYIYPPNKVFVPLNGKIDKEGNIKLADSKKSFPAFSGKLKNRMIQGSFIASEKGNQENFYAANLSGSYYRCDEEPRLPGANFQLWLTHKGYELGYYDSSNERKCLVTTHMDSKGQIYLHCDLLNSKLYLNDNALAVEAQSDLSALINKSAKKATCKESLVFRRPPSKENSNKKPRALGMTEIKLNDNYSIKLRQISEGEYIVKKFESASLRHEPYKEIKDVMEAQKILGSRFKVFKHKEYKDAYDYEITFKDKTKKKIPAIEAGFVAYYPEVEILLFEGGHTSDYSIDLNNSASEDPGNPQYHVRSPDKQLRLNGYHPGQDCPVYFLEKWNKSKNAYEVIGFLDSDDDNEAMDASKKAQRVNLCYASDWFWTSNRKALFMGYGEDENGLYHYETEIIEK